MLFKDIVTTRYKVFSRLGEEKRIGQIDAVKYIFLIASTSGVSVSDWDCQEVFGAVKGSANEIVTSKLDINKRFFEKVEELAAASPIPSEPTPLDESTKENLKILSRQYIADLIARAENDYRNRLSSAVDYQRSYEEQLRRAVEARAATMQISGQDPKVSEQIETLTEGSFWQYAGQARESSSVFVLRTKNDVICSHKNVAAEIDITVNLGKFDARFDMRGGILRVVAHSDNVFVSDYIHPHISSNGSVCWGNGGDTALRAQSSMNLIQLFTLLSSVLVNYNSSNPYRSLEDFHKQSMSRDEREARDTLDRAAREAAAANRAAAEVEASHECVVCGYDLSSCHCRWCHECDNDENDCVCNICEGCDMRVDECTCRGGGEGEPNE